MDRTILAITDFTKSSTRAILFAVNLFRYSTLKIILVNIFETPSDKDSLLISVEDIILKDSETGLKKQSAEIITTLKNEKITILTNSITGKLKKGIGKIIESEQIDLIVAGIPSDRVRDNIFYDIPLLFKVQSKYPVLLVPENCIDKPLRSILTVNFDSAQSKNETDNTLEQIINHDHISKYTITINEKKIDNSVKASLQTMLINDNVELIIFNPAPGDKIDMALADFRIQELYPTVATLLNC